MVAVFVCLRVHSRRPHIATVLSNRIALNKIIIKRVASSFAVLWCLTLGIYIERSVDSSPATNDEQLSNVVFWEVELSGDFFLHHTVFEGTSFDHQHDLFMAS